MSIQAIGPLTLTLSPSAVKREQQWTHSTTFARSLAEVSHRYAVVLTAILPLPFRRGEGRGEGKFA